MSDITIPNYPRIFLQPNEAGIGKHTWCQDRIEDTDIEYVRSDIANELLAEQEANARLMAAAPDMAAALAPFSDYAGALFTRNRNASEVAFSIVTHDGKHIDIKVGDFFAARSAIAKAGGRS
jgi:hypothetical protein